MLGASLIAQFPQLAQSVLRRAIVRLARYAQEPLAELTGAVGDSPVVKAGHNDSVACRAPST
jgi:transcriptional accessory protein Tex/SPT6